VVLPRSRDVAVAMLGGAAVLVLLWPISGQDSMPPKCWNALGSEVPCDRSSLLPALAVALALFIAMWLFTAWRARDAHSQA
jgi:hypothetical protein